LNRQRGERPYATALGFYVGDKVMIEPEELDGVVAKVYGPDSHAVVVRCDGGMMAPVEDFDLTRVG
jgi:hypothetical protein